MKISITLPDWCDERHIFILAGIELVAYKEAQEESFHVKTKRCVQCGDCCTGAKPTRFMDIVDGTCLYLIPDGKKRICEKSTHAGFNCITSDPVKDRWKVHKCSIRYKEAK